MKWTKWLKGMNENEESGGKEWNECFNIWSYVTTNDQMNDGANEYVDCKAK